MNGTYYSSVKKYNIAIFFILSFTVLFLKLPVLNAPYHWDALEAIHKAHLVKNNYFIPLCIDRFPLLPELLACSWSIFGDSLYVSHLLNIFISSIGLYFTYLLGGHLFGRKTGIISAILLLFCPLYFAQTGILNFDILFTALNLSTIYFAIKNKTKWYLISGSMLILAKEPGFLVILAVLAYDLYRVIKKESSIRHVLFRAFPLTILLIWLILCRLYQPSFHYLASLYKGVIISNWHTLGYYFKNSIAELFLRDYRWILTSIILYDFIRNRKIYAIKDLSLIISVGIAYLCFLGIIEWRMVRYLLPVYPLFFIIGSAAMVRICRRKKRLLYISIIIFSLLSVSRYDTHRAVENNTGAGAILESNMEYLDIVKTHAQAAEYIEANYPDAVILTTWPQSAELSHPYLGYVGRPITAIGIYENQRLDLSIVDLIYYSPQGHNHLLLLEKIKTSSAVLVKRFEKNKKYTAIYKIIK